MIVPHPVLLIDADNQRTLVISDIHIGFESSMASRGVRLDSMHTAIEMAEQISRISKENDISQIVLLGDTKTSTSRIQDAEWDAVPKFLERLSSLASTIIVPGNHDAGITQLAPDDVQISAPFGIVIGNDTLLTHGHVMPPKSLGSVSRIIMGHAHPILRDDTSVIGGQRVWVSMQIDKDAIFPSYSGKLELTVMPSFNHYIVAAGKRIMPKPKSPILDRATKSILQAKIVTLDGVIVGDASTISRVL